MEQITSENVTDKLEEDKYELYDRNIRLWGTENQNKLSNSHVLLINLNCVISELAKNLILAGINLYLFDKDKNEVSRKVTTADINSNFFLNSSDFNKERISIIQPSLQNINQFTSIKALDNLNYIDDVNCACVGFSSFEQLTYYEEFFTKRNIPFYCINTSGMYAFFFNNLYSFKKDEKGNDSLNIFATGSQSPKFNKNKKFITLINSPSFSKQIDGYFENLKKSKLASKKKIMRNSLYNAVCLLQMYHRRSLIYPKEYGDFQRKLFFMENYLKQNDLALILDNEEFDKIFNKLVKNFNYEFNPVCSIIAGIVSQEVLKVLTNSPDIHKSLYTFDSEHESGNFLNLLAIQ